MASVIHKDDNRHPEHKDHKSIWGQKPKESEKKPEKPKEETGKEKEKDK